MDNHENFIRRKVNFEEKLLKLDDSDKSELKSFLQCTEAQLQADIDRAYSKAFNGVHVLLRTAIMIADSESS